MHDARVHRTDWPAELWYRELFRDCRRAYRRSIPSMFIIPPPSTSPLPPCGHDDRLIILHTGAQKRAVHQPVPASPPCISHQPSGGEGKGAGGGGRSQPPEGSRLLHVWSTVSWCWPLMDPEPTQPCGVALIRDSRYPKLQLKQREQHLRHPWPASQHWHLGAQVVTRSSLLFFMSNQLHDWLVVLHQRDPDIFDTPS
jgi:hypothetical protein